MAANIEELRREKERLEREREEVERRLAEAERFEREQAASGLLDELFAMTDRIDAMKAERQAMIARIREAAPRLGDFTYAQEDWKLTVQATRTGFKQPILVDRILEALQQAGLRIEPRAPKFRLFHKLRPVGTLQIAPKRLVLTASEPVLDSAIVDAVREIEVRYPGLASIEWASEKKVRRVKANIPFRIANGDFATQLTFAATDTGTLDVVLPIALRALDHVAAWWDKWTPEEDARVFEPWPEEAPARVAMAPAPAPAPMPVVEAPVAAPEASVAAVEAALEAVPEPGATDATAPGTAPAPEVAAA